MGILANDKIGGSDGLLAAILSIVSGTAGVPRLSRSLLVVERRGEGFSFLFHRRWWRAFCII